MRKKKKNNSIDYEKRKQHGTWMAAKRAYSKAYYIQHNKRMKTQARIAYKIDRKNKFAMANVLSKLVHALNPELIKAKCKTWYNKHKASKQIKSRRYSKLKYLQNHQKARQRSVVTYSQNAEHIKQRAREHSAVSYNQNPEPIKQRAREHSTVTYAQNPEPIKHKAREHSAVTYAQNTERQRKRAREYSSKSYKENPGPKRIKARECSFKNYIKMLTLKRKWH